MNKYLLAGAFLLSVFGADFAYAQSQTVQQSGSVTSGHAASWTYNGVIQDAGTSTNPNISTLGVYGTGTPSCVSNTKVRTGGWYNLCIGYAANLSAGQISLNAFGGASNIPLDLVINGTTYSIGGANWLSTLLDSQFGSAQGDILYRNSTVWTVLTPGTAGNFLVTNGPSANPAWAAGTSLSAIAANTVLANVTNSTAVPTAAPMTSCSSSSLSVNYTNNVGFTCVPLPTEQVLTSGTAATYNTPAGARQLRITLVGGGGGGGGSTQTGNDGGAGSAGGSTIFNSIAAAGGGGALGGASSGIGGAGGTGGAGVAAWRSPGNAGPSSSTASGSGATLFGQTGAPSSLGGGAASGGSGANNTGAGGGGGAVASSAAASIAGGGGGSGETVHIIINNPSSTYTYTVGAFGARGVAGTSGAQGGDGGSGIIIVDEYY